MKLYLEQHPAPSLWLHVPDAPDLFLKARRDSNKARAGTFHIATRTGSEEQKGHVVGNYAVSRGTSGSWDLTHVPTGMRLTSTFNGKADAIGLAEFLHRAHPDAGGDFTFGELSTEQSRSLRDVNDAASVYKYGTEKPSMEEMRAADKNQDNIKAKRDAWLADKTGEPAPAPVERVEGLEGPFTFAGGAKLYYDPKEGKYYDRGKDMYLDRDEATRATSTTPEYDKEREESHAPESQGAVQTGPRGGRYIETTGGGKHYVGKNMDLYLDLGFQAPELHLDVTKANPHRDPSVGQFIAGGTGKAQSGDGQHDLENDVLTLMERLPGEELDKDE